MIPVPPRSEKKGTKSFYSGRKIVDGVPPPPRGLRRRSWNSTAIGGARYPRGFKIDGGGGDEIDQGMRWREGATTISLTEFNDDRWGGGRDLSGNSMATRGGGGRPRGGAACDEPLGDQNSPPARAVLGRAARSVRYKSQYYRLISGFISHISRFKCGFNAARLIVIIWKLQRLI